MQLSQSEREVMMRALVSALNSEREALRRARRGLPEFVPMHREEVRQYEALLQRLRQP